MLRVVEKPTKANEELRTTLDELLQRGALKMLHETLEAEVEEYIRRHREARDERGRAQVVRNGKAPARQLPCPPEKTLVLAQTKTRLKRLDATVQERLINWGYAICDAAMRRWVESGLSATVDFPYSAAGVG